MNLAVPGHSSLSLSSPPAAADEPTRGAPPVPRRISYPDRPLPPPFFSDSGGPAPTNSRLPPAFLVGSALFSSAPSRLSVVACPPPAAPNPPSLSRPSAPPPAVHATSPAANTRRSLPLFFFPNIVVENIVCPGGPDALRDGSLRRSGCACGRAGGDCHAAAAGDTS